MITVEQFLLVGIVTMMVVLWAARSPKLVMLIGAGLVLRFVAGGIDQTGVMSLPWSGADSESFYARAIQYSELNGREYLSGFNPREAYVYSWVLGLVIKIFGAEYFYLRVLNMLIGVITAVVIYRSVLLAGGAQKAALLASAVYLLFPFSIILNSVLLREAIITLCIALMSMGLLRYYRGYVNGLILAVGAICLAALFHGAMALLLVLLLLGVAAFPPTDVSGVSRRSLLALPEVRFAFGFIVLIGAVYVVLFAEFSKVGNLANAAGILDARLSRVAEQGAKGGSGYPAWLTSNTANPLYWIPRFLYFLAAPFPWDWRSPIDMVSGMVSLAYILVFTWAARARRLSRGLFVCFGLLVAGLFLYSLGTDNIGTAIRHRSKFLPLLLILGLTWHGSVKVAEDAPRFRGPLRPRLVKST